MTEAIHMTADQRAAHWREVASQRGLRVAELEAALRSIQALRDRRNRLGRRKNPQHLWGTTLGIVTAALSPTGRT